MSNTSFPKQTVCILITSSNRYQQEAMEVKKFGDALLIGNGLFEASRPQDQQGLTVSSSPQKNPILKSEKNYNIDQTSQLTFEKKLKIKKLKSYSKNVGMDTSSGTPSDEQHKSSNNKKRKLQGSINNAQTRQIGKELRGMESCSSQPTINKKKCKQEGSSNPISIPGMIQKGFTFEEFMDGVRDKTFRHVSFMVGAGISVAAGIPDFRTPKTGLYAQVKALGLPVPEDIFSLDCFLDDPQPFYSLATQFLFPTTSLDQSTGTSSTCDQGGTVPVVIRPVKAHHFMELINRQQRCLHFVYTQNIDGLELVAGLPLKKVIQAHGNMRSAHCCQCKAEYSIEEFAKYAHRHEIWYCQLCNTNTKGGANKETVVTSSSSSIVVNHPTTERNLNSNILDTEEVVDIPILEQPLIIEGKRTRRSNSTVAKTSDYIAKNVIKPDIIFFGEKLPKSFHRQLEKIKESDLVIVMGTSLKVAPFSTLLQNIPKTTPMVLINRDMPTLKSLQEKEKLLFLPGEIESTISLIVDQLGWSLECE